MTKVRKLKRRKKYRYNVNRKRLNKKRLPSSECKVVKDAWNARMSSQKNFKKMGLSFDVNKDIRLLNREDKAEQETVTLASVENITSESTSAPVVEELAKEAKARKIKNYRLPIGQVKFLTYLMDKYQDDYKAMSRDKRNYLQQTWKQIRSKINTFKRIPEQYNEYLQRKKEAESQDSSIS